MSMVCVSLMIMMAGISTGTTEAAEVSAAELFNRAEAMRAEGRDTAAEPLYVEALAAQERIFGVDRPELLPTLNALGHLYRRQGRDRAAEPMYRRALDLAERTLKPLDPEIGYSLTNLANVYTATGRYVSAEPLHRRALAILRGALGPDDPSVARVLNNLAFLRVATEHYDEALVLFHQALEISEKSGSESTQTASILYNIAICHTRRGTFREAEPYLLRSMRIVNAMPARDNPPVIALLETYGLVLRKTRRASQAKEVDLRVTMLRQNREAR